MVPSLHPIQGRNSMPPATHKRCNYLICCDGAQNGTKQFTCCIAWIETIENPNLERHFGRKVGGQWRLHAASCHGPWKMSENWAFQWWAWKSDFLYAMNIKIGQTFLRNQWVWALREPKQILWPKRMLRFGDFVGDSLSMLSYLTHPHLWNHRAMQVLRISWGALGNRSWVWCRSCCLIIRCCWRAEKFESSQSFSQS